MAALKAESGIRLSKLTACWACAAKLVKHKASNTKSFLAQNSGFTKTTVNNVIKASMRKVKRKFVVFQQK